MGTVVTRKIGVSSKSITFTETPRAFSYCQRPFAELSYDYELINNDALNISETYSKAAFFVKNLLESVGVAELISKNNSKFFSSIFFIGNTRAQNAIGKLTLSFSEYNKMFSSFPANPGDRVNFAIAKNVIQNINIDKGDYKSIAHKEVEAASICDVINKRALYDRCYSDNICTKDSSNPNFVIDKKCFDKLYLSEGYKRNIAINKEIGIVFLENQNRRMTFDRAIAETIDLIEHCSNNSKINIREDLKMIDKKIRSHNGVISNLCISEDTLTDELFAEKINVIAGYTKFFDFLVGDYEYKDAVARISIKTSDMASPTIERVIMHVDIPDTDDRGTKRITDTSSPTKIYFNKHYYNPPEVQITLLSGNNADGLVIPNIISTDGKDEYGRYFTVVLVNSYGKYTTGNINWVSKGY